MALLAACPLHAAPRWPRRSRQPWAHPCALNSEPSAQNLVPGAGQGVLQGAASGRQLRQLPAGRAQRAGDPPAPQHCAFCTTDRAARGLLAGPSSLRPASPGSCVLQDGHSVQATSPSTARLLAHCRQSCPGVRTQDGRLPRACVSGASRTLRTLQVDHPEGGRAQAFTFDAVFGPGSGQAAVFAQVSELVQSALDGYQVRCPPAWHAARLPGTLGLPAAHQHLPSLPAEVPHERFAACVGHAGRTVGSDAGPAAPASWIFCTTLASTECLPRAEPAQVCRRAGLTLRSVPPAGLSALGSC